MENSPIDERVIRDVVDESTQENPYLEELKKIAALHKLVAGARTITFAGVPHHAKELRRAKNYRSRASRRINRLRAKGKL